MFICGLFYSALSRETWSWTLVSCSKLQFMQVKLVGASSIISHSHSYLTFIPETFVFLCCNQHSIAGQVTSCSSFKVKSSCKCWWNRQTGDWLDCLRWQVLYEQCWYSGMVELPLYRFDDLPSIGRPGNYRCLSAGIGSTLLLHEARFNVSFKYLFITYKTCRWFCDQWLSIVIILQTDLWNC